MNGDREGPDLIPLKDAGDLEIADEGSDIRGWPVFGRDGQRIGRVHELLADPDAMEVRALDVGVDEEALGPGGADRHLRVPLGDARIERDAQRVVLDHFGRERLRRLAGGAAPARADSRPAERPAERTQEDEAPEGRADERVEEARIPRVEEEMDVQRRLVDAGEVRLHKRVDTEHVARDVEASREDYDVQRLPADQVNAAAPAEGEIRIPIVEEEIVVEKRPVVREVLVLRKRVVTETRRIEADLRREHVDVERQGRTGGDDAGLARAPEEGDAPARNDVARDVRSAGDET